METEALKNSVSELNRVLQSNNLDLESAKKSGFIRTILENIWQQWKVAIGKNVGMRRRFSSIGILTGILGSMVLPAGSIILALILWYLRNRPTGDFKEWVMLQEILDDAV